MKTKTILATLLALLPAAAAPLACGLPSPVHQVAAAQPPATVCKIGGCTGVLITPDGLVMTAGHCQDAGPLIVEIEGRREMAHLLHLGPNADGPAVYQIKPPLDPPLEAAQLAPAPPPAGSRADSWGYPIHTNRTLAHATGTVTRGGQFLASDTRRGVLLDVHGNRATISVGPGWSGGPLFHDGKLAGILTGGGGGQSIWISHRDTAQTYRAALAMQAQGDQRPELRIYSRTLCLACGAFWSDYEKDPRFRAAIDKNYRIRKLRPEDDPQQTDADQVDTVPAFITDGIRVVGYETLNPNRKHVLTKALGIDQKQAPPPPPIPDTPPSPTPAVQWDAVQVILLIEERETSQLGGLLLGLVEGRAVGPIRRAVSDATEGKADLVPVFQRTEPARFEAVELAAGIDVQTVHVIAMVKKQDLGLLRGIIAKHLERALAEKLDFTPIVEVITERGHAADFRAITTALDTPPTEIWQPGPADPPSPPPTEQQPEAAGIVDRLQVALETARKLRDPQPGDDQPEDNQDPWQQVTTAGVLALIARHAARSARRWWNQREGAAT